MTNKQLYRDYSGDSGCYAWVHKKNGGWKRMCLGGCMLSLSRVSNGYRIRYSCGGQSSTRFVRGSISKAKKAAMAFRNYGIRK